MLRVFGIDIPRTVDEVVCHHRTALLIYDLHVGILRQMQGLDAVIEKVRVVLQAARELGLWTYFVRLTSLPKNLTGRFQIRQALAWQRLSVRGSCHTSGQ